MNAVAAGAFAIALCVALGAFGAHALSGLDAARARFWSIAADYHLIGALGLLTLGIVQRFRPGARGASWVLAAGIVLFSGSLYAMALGAPRALGRITPIGGLCLIAGWVWTGVHAAGLSRNRR